jgi:hypothetical protein
VLKILGDYLTALLDFDPEKIIIGRENFLKLDTNNSFIILDYLASTPLGGFKEFDGEAEKISIGTLTRFRATILTIGDNASDNINNIELLIKSQKGLELQSELGIRVGYSLGVRNLKELHGSIFTDTFEMELNIDTVKSIDVDTLRIDEIQILINNEEGVIYDGSI